MPDRSGPIGLAQLLQDPNFCVPLVGLVLALLGVCIIVALQRTAKKPASKLKISTENIGGGTALVDDGEGHVVRRSLRYFFSRCDVLQQ